MTPKSATPMAHAPTSRRCVSRVEADWAASACAMAYSADLSYVYTSGGTFGGSRVGGAPPVETGTAGSSQGGVMTGGDASSARGASLTMVYGPPGGSDASAPSHSGPTSMVDSGGRGALSARLAAAGVTTRWY